MKRVLVISVLSFIVISCQTNKEFETLPSENWSEREFTEPLLDSLSVGETYLSVYSEIYSVSEKSRHSLTVTVSMRNPSIKDTVFVSNADFYDSHGELLKQYVEKPIFIAPMETLDIIIGEKNNSGGTGANFIFKWKSKLNGPDPIFEGVMISTMGQQGLSFTTQGVRIK